MQIVEDGKQKKYFVIVSVVLFVLSLTQKSYCTTTSCGDSIMALLLGWAGILSGAAGFTWFANPLLLACWITLRKNLKAAMFLSVAATLLSGSFLLFDSIKDNEGGIPHQIITYKPGYWLWLGSCATMLVGTFWLMLRHNTRMAAK
jgi:hypothetical protein